jgi:hypothetical protein
MTHITLTVEALYGIDKAIEENNFVRLRENGNGIFFVSFFDVEEFKRGYNRSIGSIAGYNLASALLKGSQHYFNPGSVSPMENENEVGVTHNLLGVEEFTRENGVIWLLPEKYRGLLASKEVLSLRPKKLSWGSVGAPGYLNRGFMSIEARTNDGEGIVTSIDNQDAFEGLKLLDDLILDYFPHKIIRL